MTNSKRKGSKNERGIAHLFSEWTGFKFSRTPQSGGMGWHNKLSTGDIICIDELHMSEFSLSIECKFHSDLDFSHMIDGTIGKKTNKVVDFWEQCERDAKRLKKIPCLFMRRNGMKTDMHFVAIPLSFYMIYLSSYDFIPKFGYIAFQNDEMKIAILNSEDFFSLPYKQFHGVAKAYRVNWLVKKILKKR
jgi:Holliday junction resolvase